MHINAYDLGTKTSFNAYSAVRQECLLEDKDVRIKQFPRKPNFIGECKRSSLVWTIFLLGIVVEAKANFVHKQKVLCLKELEEQLI